MASLCKMLVNLPKLFSLYVETYMNCIRKQTNHWAQYKLKLDVDPRRNDHASPMSSYRFILRRTWTISALWHKSKYKSKFYFKFFWKKNQIFGFPCCSTRKDLSSDVSITNVGLILTKPGWFHFSGYGQTNTISESSYMETCRHAKNFISKLGVSCRSQYASQDDENA